jgi:hypothetical protein
VGNARKKSFSYISRERKHDFSVTTNGQRDLLGARQERKHAKNETIIAVSLVDSHRIKSIMLMCTCEK